MGVAYGIKFRFLFQLLKSFRPTHTFGHKMYRIINRSVLNHALTTNWIAEAENKVTITSASATSLYGKDATGAGMKTDEVLQSGWSPIAGLLGTKVNSVIGQIDQSSIYATDATSKVMKCEGDCSTNAVTPVDTQGYTPLNLTADPTS